ncbi:MAG: AAA family ATPase, partial [Solirubrobacteraceae bacterium]
MESVIGRERELEAAAAFLEAPTSGLSALQISGDPGIGKTTVLDAIAARAEELGHRVLRCVPAESESSMPFVSLGDLLEPVLDGGPPSTMPAAQRRALDAALVRVEPQEAFGRLAVSRATLTLVRRLVAERPLLVALDDTQWVDSSSAAVLQFVFRRLALGEVRAVTAARSGAPAPALEPPPGHETLRISVGPLSIDELGRLMASRLSSPLTRPRLAELHRVTRGNPYFALEIARALVGRQRPLEPASSLPIPDDIAALLGARIAELSEAARDVLVLCACTPQPTAPLISRVSGSPGLDEVLAAGIVERTGDRLRFAHPLLASYVYGDADRTVLQDAHARLAAAIEVPQDRAVHLARSTDTPDEAIARELEAAALSAHRRGAAPAAAELEEHARRLTPPQLQQEGLRRATKTAEYHHAAGDTQRARELLERLLDTPLADRDRARVMLRLGELRYVSDDVAAAHALFEAALARAGEDVALRAEAEQSLAFTSMLAGDIPGALVHARAAIELAEAM